jgi:RimJ/RimL family protein N-acetyltransferase
MGGDIIHETPRLWLTSWELEDFDAFAPIARDPQVMRYIAAGQPWPDARIGWFMGLQRAYQHSLGHCCWKLVEKDTGTLIGFCGIAPLPQLGETEIGWWLKRSHWGRGLAREAAHQVCRAAFADHGLTRLVARVYAQNTASLRLIDGLGMTYSRDLETTAIGKVLLYQKDGFGPVPRTGPAAR